jgi:hypothetical protein
MNVTVSEICQFRVGCLGFRAHVDHANQKQHRVGDFGFALLLFSSVAWHSASQFPDLGLLGLITGHMALGITLLLFFFMAR